MKCMTIMQPWASALAFGLKKYETRSRKSKHRGLFAIHAGKKFDPAGIDEQFAVPWIDHIRLPLTRMFGPVTDVDFPTGCIVAVGVMSDCIEMDASFIADQTAQERSLGNWEEGNYAYKIDNVVILKKPVVISGKQGLWNWEPQEGDLDGIDLPDVE